MLNTMSIWEKMPFHQLYVSGTYFVCKGDRNNLQFAGILLNVLLKRAMYKLMVLPLLDYSGFLLVACTLEQKNELQKRQNNAIRTCLLHDRREHVTIDRLHEEMGLISLEQRGWIHPLCLEQRRNIQLLKLMFSRSKNILCIKEPVRALQGNGKIKFKLMSRCTGKYLNSPLFRGSVLWDKLTANVQKLMSV